MKERKKVVIQTQVGRLIVLFSVGIACINQIAFAQQTISCGPNKVLVCHKGKNTLCISENAVQAHLDHGDYLGSCSGNECGVIATGGLKTCKDSFVTLSAISNTTGVTYSWSGPNNYTSGLDTPRTNLPGIYTVTVTDVTNGCTATDTALVTEDTAPPAGVTANNNGPLTCSKTDIKLTSSSTTSGVTYHWTGPGNFISTLQNPSTGVAGSYTLKVTDSNNGCTSTNTTNVSQNNTAPGANAIGGKLTCHRTSVTLIGSPSSAGIVYSWSGPGSFTSTAQNPIVSIAGSYTLTVTNSANGCISTDTAIVTQNITTPGATAGGGTLTCANTSVSLSGTSVTPGVTYFWSGPENFSSNLQNPGVNKMGTYTLTVTNPADGCNSTATAEVAQDRTLPGASGNVNGILTCSRTAVILTGNSSTSGVTYTWSGPLIFASTEQKPVTSSPGTYSLVVTNPANGCASKDSVIVIQDTSTARGISTMVSSTLNCKVKNVTLTGSSISSEVSFSWSGPNGFISTDQSLTVSTPGNYVFHVCKKSSGCVAYADVSVLLDTIKPKGVAASASGILGCTRSTVVLTGSSSTDGVSYEWAGPDFVSTEAIANVTNPGTYLTVTNPVNHCYTLSGIDVIKNQSLPTGVKASVSGKLTCANPNTTISVTSTPSDVVYFWKGPENYNSNERSSSISKPGIYMVTVTNPYNDCKVTDSIKVQQDITSPEKINANVNGIITCSNLTVTLYSYSSTPGVMYSWTGPYGYTSIMQNPKVNSAGTYTLTVIDTINGCKKDTSVIVEQNEVKPDKVTASVSNALDCINDFVILTGSSSTTGAQYLWQSPDNTKDPNSVSYAVTPGVYKLRVTNPANGCKDSANVTVVRDTVSPVSHILQPANSPLALTNDTLSAQASNNATYLWGLSSSNSHWSIVSGYNSRTLKYLTGDGGSSATFALMVTSNQNGCSSTSQLTLKAASSKSASQITDNQGTEKAFQIKAYPNPFSDKAVIEFVSEQDGLVTIELYTNQGILSGTIFNGEVHKSQSYKIVVDGTTMPSGNYYCSVRLNQHVYLYKLLLIK